jgi:hypothetical protein
VLWPETGFLTADGKQVAPDYTHSHPHPSGIIAEDPKDGKKYIYVFACMTNPDPRLPRRVVAARSPLSERGLPGTFHYLYKGEYGSPALPADMSGSVREVCSRKGGKADPIHPGARGDINRFSVARLKRSGLFLGVEHVRYDGRSRSETCLRLSEDLVNWSERIPVPGTEVTRGMDRSERFRTVYPKFLSADGRSHYEVDESEPFYIIATKPHHLVYREMEIRII